VFSIGISIFISNLSSSPVSISIFLVFHIISDTISSTLFIHFQSKLLLVKSTRQSSFLKRVSISLLSSNNSLLFSAKLHVSDKVFQSLEHIQS